MIRPCVSASNSYRLLPSLWDSRRTGLDSLTYVNSIDQYSGYVSAPMPQNGGPCVIGVVMGLALPAVAWVDQAATLLLLCTVALLIVIAVFWLAGG
jgi:hypothetical protein